MADLGIKSQAAFAKALGLRPTTLNAWMTGVALPSPEVSMRLSIKAPKIEDSIFFCGLAGLTPELLISAANKLGQNRLAQTQPQKYVTIAHKRRRGQDLQDVEPAVEVPAGLVRDPILTFYFELDVANGSGANGVLVDTRDDPTGDVRAFLGQLVLVQFPVHRQVNDYFNGPHVGYLYLTKGDNKVAGTSWVLRFVSQSVGDFYPETAIVGEWTEPLDWNREAQPIATQLHCPACFILGRVVGSWRLATVEGKK
jgi:transcriptional regulator with XRE-family HTH domain